MSSTDLLDTFRSRRRWVYPFADLCTLSGLSRPSARRLGERLVAKERLARPVRGWYALPDCLPETFATQRSPPSFVSFGSALALHEMVARRLPRLLIASGRSFHRLRWKGTDIVWVRLRPDRLFGFEWVRRDGQPVALASPERAVADCLLLTRWADFEELAGLVPQLRSRELLAITARLGSSAALKRAAFLVSRAGRHVPASVRRGISPSIDLLQPSLPAEGPVDPTWRLRINCEVP